jgi:hypothetical protein
MPRTLRTTTLMVTGSAVLGLGLATGPAAAATARPAAVHPDVCSTVTPLQINGFAFYPAQVPPGQSATADLISTNCTTQSLATEEEWTGRWLPASGTGPAPGCPVIDPFLREVYYAPGQQVAQNTVYVVPAGCSAAELAVTVTITTLNGSAGQSVSATAYLRIVQTVP